MRASISSARLAPPLPQPDGSVALEFVFGADDPVFVGHFPGRPILPGVFQLEIIRQAAEWIEAASLSVREIVRAKFQRPIVPGEVLKLNLRLAVVDGVIAARGAFVCGGQPAGEAFLRLCRNG